MNIKYMCFCVFIKKFVVIQNNYKITLKLCRENCQTKINKNFLKYIICMKNNPSSPPKERKYNVMLIIIIIKLCRRNQ